MDESPDYSHEVAEELLRVLPFLGRVLALMIRKSGDEDTTLMQISVLFQIESCPMTTSDLARKRRVSLQAASALVQGMVERGWMTRTREPHDRRQWLLQITPAGRAHIEGAKAQAANYLAGLLEKLSAEEVQAARVFLPALNQLLIQQMAASDFRRDDPITKPED